MALAHRTTAFEQQNLTATTSPSGKSDSNIQSTWLRLLDQGIFGFLLLFAITLPHSIKGAERSWKIALFLWLVKLAIGRLRPYKQSLAAPLLAYVSLSAISTLLSPDPYLSWDRMKFVCLCLAGIVVAQNVRRLSQVRWLVVALVLSGLTAALYTGWQYTYGIGVRLAQLPPVSRLSQEGLQKDDILTSFNGRRTYTFGQLMHAIEQVPPATGVTVEYLRDRALRPSAVTASPQDFLQSGFGTASVKLSRGKPIRAQGTLGHYVVFAEMLMQIGCMAWALLLATERRNFGWKLTFGIAFAAITAALFATATRAAVVGLVLGCLLSLLLLTKRMTRVVAIGVLIAILAGAIFWIQRSRRIEWVDQQDPGTHFRVLMWEDGLRLVREHPLFGVGMETARVHWREWNIRGFIQYNVQSHFHSTFLQIAVERGIPALLAWLWFCVAYIVFLIRLIPKLRAQSRFAFGVLSGVLAGFLAFTSTSFFHYNLGEEPVAMMLFFSYGLAVAMDRLAKTPEAMDVS